MATRLRLALLLVATLASSALASDPPTAASVSEFLRPPGESRYETTDWAALPPWQQTSFFGVRAKGKVFVFVVDCSGSMGDDGRLARAKTEIRRAVAAMRWPQKYYVIFYNDRALSMPGGVPADPDARSQAQLASWLRLVDPEGETDPRDAMAQAVGLRPDAVFLLSDGEFPDGAVESINKKNARHVPIHCIDLAGAGGAEGLRAIAKESGGTYALRPR